MSKKRPVILIFFFLWKKNSLAWKGVDAQTELFNRNLHVFFWTAKQFVMLTLWCALPQLVSFDFPSFPSLFFPPVFLLLKVLFVNFPFVLILIPPPKILKIQQDLNKWQNSTWHQWEKKNYILSIQTYWAHLQKAVLLQSLFLLFFLLLHDQPFIHTSSEAFKTSG